MVEVVKLVERLASAPSNVLLSGESGTGKDLVAHALHFWGPRSGFPIVKVDLPSIPAELIESELFGYERGAFTGATATKLGRLEMAKNGTLFLDQIGSFPQCFRPNCSGSSRTDASSGLGARRSSSWTPG